MFFLMKKMQLEICTDAKQPNVKHTVSCNIEGLSGLNNWLMTVATEDTRAKLIADGEKQGTLFLEGL